MSLGALKIFSRSSTVAQTQVTGSEQHDERQAIADYLQLPVEVLSDLTREQLAQTTVSTIRNTDPRALSDRPELVLNDFIFNLANGESVTFPANVRLNNCKIEQGEIVFHHGDLMATDSSATATACGEDAIAQSCNCGRALAITNGAHAIAHQRGIASAKVAGSVARAVGLDSISYAQCVESYCFADGMRTHASAGNGGMARATVDGAAASATGPDTHSYADSMGSVAHAVGGATAYATSKGAKAFAKAGSVARAEGELTDAEASDGGTAIAKSKRSGASAKGPKSRSYAEHSGSIAAAHGGASAYGKGTGSKVVAFDKSFAYADGPKVIAEANGKCAVAIQLHPESIARLSPGKDTVGAKVILLEDQADPLSGQIQGGQGNRFITDQDL